MASCFDLSHWSLVLFPFWFALCTNIFQRLPLFLTLAHWLQTPYAFPRTIIIFSIAIFLCVLSRSLARKGKQHIMKSEDDSSSLRAYPYIISIRIALQHCPNAIRTSRFQQFECGLHSFTQFNNNRFVQFGNGYGAVGGWTMHAEYAQCPFEMESNAQFNYRLWVELKF